MTTDELVEFQENLNHYHFLAEEKNGMLHISATEKADTSHRFKVMGLFVIMIIGLCTLTLRRRLGMFIIITAIISLGGLMNLKQREKEARKRSIVFEEDHIEITEKFRRDRVKFEDISEFQINTKMDKRVAQGSLIVLDDNNMPFQLIELIGKNEAELEEDLAIIAHFINEHYVSKE